MGVSRSTAALAVWLAAVLAAECAASSPEVTADAVPAPLKHVADAGGNAPHATASDATLFATVLEAVEPFRQGLLHVDPRPLRATPPQESARSEEALAAVGDEVVRAREEVLHRLGIPVTG